MGREIGGDFRREETYVYLWLIHVHVWQKPAQYCKAIILQLKINNFFKKRLKKKSPDHFCILGGRLGELRVENCEPVTLFVAISQD